jgi:hypothetical protein
MADTAALAGRARPDSGHSRFQPGTATVVETVAGNARAGVCEAGRSCWLIGATHSPQPFPSRALPSGQLF